MVEGSGPPEGKNNPVGSPNDNPVLLVDASPSGSDELGPANWPTLQLEYATSLASFNAKPLDLVEEMLEDWLDDDRALAPVSIELLQQVRMRAQAVGRPKVMSLADRHRNRLAPFVPIVATALHQLMRPLASSSPAAISTLSTDVVRQLRDGTIAHHLGRDRVEEILGATCHDDAIESLWLRRFVPPFKQSDGSWKISATSAFLARPWDEWSPTDWTHFAAQTIDSYWTRWNDILQTFPGLWPVKPLIADQLRRALSTHILMVDTGDARACFPVPVFSMLLPNTDRAVHYLGAADGAAVVTVDSDFHGEIARARKLAVEMWALRNRSWEEAGYASGRKAIGNVLNSTLFLDLRRAHSAWSRVVATGDDAPGMRLTGRSAGLTVAMSVLGTVAGHPPDPTTWVTGTIADLIPDRFGRGYFSPGEVLSFDGVAGWPDGDPDDAIRRKLIATSAHSLANRLVYAATADTSIRDAVADLKLRVEPAPVSKVSEAADVALPLPYSKYRYVGCADLQWAAAEHRHPLYRRRDASQLHEMCKANAVVVVPGSASSGKSYLILDYLAGVRQLLGSVMRTGPRVTWFRYPRAFRFDPDSWDVRPSAMTWVSEAWTILMAHLNFPQSTIAEFLRCSDVAARAEVFVEALRAHGPDILIVDGLAEVAAHEYSNGAPGLCGFVETLFAIGKILLTHPRPREDVVSENLGLVELIVEWTPGLQLPNDEDPFHKPAIFRPRPMPWHTPRAVDRAFRELSRASAERRKPPWFLASVLGVAAAFQDATGTDLPRLCARAFGGGDGHSIEQATEYLATQRLCWVSSHERRGFRIASDDDRYGPSRIDTGPLLRWHGSRWHVHPLLAAEAHRRFVVPPRPERHDSQVRKRLQSATLHYEIAATELTPYAAHTSSALVGSFSSMLAERVVESHQHLELAGAILDFPYAEPDFAKLRSEVANAHGRLLRYFHDPSLELVAKLPELGSRMDGVDNVTLAHDLGRRMSDRTSGPLRVELLLRAGSLAERIARRKVPTGENPAAGELRGKALASYLDALEEAEALPHTQRQYWSVRVLGRLCGSIARLFSARGFPFGAVLPRHLLPDGKPGVSFVGGACEETWWRLLAPASSGRHMTPALGAEIDVGDFAGVGDRYYRAEHYDRALEVFALGLRECRRRDVHYIPIEVGAWASAWMETGNVPAAARRLGLGDLEFVLDWLRIRSRMRFVAGVGHFKSAIFALDLNTTTYAVNEALDAFSAGDIPAERHRSLPEILLRTADEVWRPGERESHLYAEFRRVAVDPTTREYRRRLEHLRRRLEPAFKMENFTVPMRIFGRHALPVVED